MIRHPRCVTEACDCGHGPGGRPWNTLTKGKLVVRLVKKTAVVSNTANDQVTMFDLEFQTLRLPASGEKGHRLSVTATRRVHALQRRDRAADTSVVLNRGQGASEILRSADWARCA